MRVAVVGFQSSVVDFHLSEFAFLIFGNIAEIQLFNDNMRQ